MCLHVDFIQLGYILVITLGQKNQDQPNKTRHGTMGYPGQVQL